MKLGISYLIFEGDEILKFAIKTIRPAVDFISVIYQTTSFIGNQAHEQLVPNLKAIEGIDKLIEYEPDVSKGFKWNEQIVRNMGLRFSKEAGCSHHISFDADELCEASVIEKAKNELDGYDSSVVYVENYFKHPTYKIQPSQNHVISFILPVSAKYDMEAKFPFNIERTRKCKPCEKCRVFTKEEFYVHHMSFVRNNIRTKLENAPSRTWYKIDRFVEDFNKYKLGDKLIVAPEFITRRTIFVDNKFEI